VSARDGRSLRELFEAELALHGITWCRGCESRHSHKRGFADAKTRTVHYAREIGTRASLHGGLHEIGHVVCGHGPGARPRRFEKEAEAEAWAMRRMRELGVPVSRKEQALGRAYVARMKQWGRNITAGRRGRA
jgi:hypothetical protein